MKRIFILLVIVTLCAGCLSSAAASEGFLVPDGAGNEADEGVSAPIAASAGTEADYQAARHMLENGDLITAVNAFAKLGTYQDAAKYTAYISATLSLLRNDPSAAADGFADLGDFLDSGIQKQLALALSQHRYFDGSRFGYVDLDGTVRIIPQFDWAERSFRKESYSPAAQETADSIVLPVAAVFAGSVANDGKDLTPLEGKYGLLRADGELIVPMEYDEILWTTEGMAALRDGERTTLINLQSGEKIGEAFEEVGEYSEGFVAVKQGGKWGYMDRDGHLLADGFVWDNALPFHEGMAGVLQDKLAGFINASGSIVIPLQYQAVASFGNGLAGFQQNKKWGFLNARGEIVLKPAYQEISTFTQERCVVKRSGKWGIIDTEGKVILKMNYDEVTDFDPIYHRAWMRNNKLWGLVSQDGAVVLKPAWASFTPFGAEGISCVSYKGKYGYIDTRGVNRVPNMYDIGLPFSAGLGGVKSGDGIVRYLTKLQRGFTLDTDIPTMPLNGFIESRKINTIRNVEINPETGEETIEIAYQITFALYDLEGNPILGTP